MRLSSVATFSRASLLARGACAPSPLARRFLCVGVKKWDGEKNVHGTPDAKITSVGMGDEAAEAGSAADTRKLRGGGSDRARPGARTTATFGGKISRRLRAEHHLADQVTSRRVTGPICCNSKCTCGSGSPS